ncbi:MAG: hypothetical protein EI684_14215 [Candidatus Viridilinea halotolerans]|uniref:site-specific DNA-methyltransferase (adenine-specific) n=1 Tax=Candidatus Viridilinea halotolerans TaxID=2491704 RepID=A0A426TWP8_9CHLR|nr:MAG: hypothetical protein EI684_14215 [Candidatus Viridilinea halotolerans]
MPKVRTMTPSQLALATQVHRNQQLFSDYYLNYILPRSGDWRALTDRAALLLQEVQTIWAAFVPSANEAQTEDGLIKPVLQALGHTFEVQAALRTPDGTKKPDYVFYRDAAARDALKGAMLDDALPSHGCFAVGDAKYWDRPLDMTLRVKSGDAFNNKNPAFQIHFYMQHSGAEWGILTNGRLWRLYHKETAHKLDRFYEIDLPLLLERNDPAALLYFYVFFHRSAFDEHPLALRNILRASTEFARGISDNLKEQVYDALRCIAQGFLDYRPNALGRDPATLKTIFDHSLILLYRLLFVFYAEARDLLPLRANKAYRKFYSLHAIKREIVLHDVALLPGSAAYWQRLRMLFNFINVGSPPLNIATFNGGLFDPAKYPFLEEKSVGDARLIQAIDMLARVDGKFIDYRDLAERHLGTIYEGLLEYHLEALASEAPWGVALLNDKGERKASGSYYTPDYIVKYIVDQTVGPALRRAVAGLDDDAAKIRAVLALNICDPAMGSGHFLVEATEYIARFLVDLALPPDEKTDEADLAYWKRRVAQSCIYGVDLNPLAVDLAKLSLWLATVAQDRPLSFLDHHLRCGNALIGARLADLELGGVAPKSGKAQRAAAPTAQLALFSDDAFRQSISTAVSSMWLIEDKAGNTVAEVKEQEQIYGELRATLTRKYGRLANLATAKHFGLDVPADLNTPLHDYASGRTMAAVSAIEHLLHQADASAAERRFFHWELEFPEVFFDRHGAPLGDAAGFDVVVGNPPYIRAETADKDQRNYIIKSGLYTTVWGRFDVYAIFIEKGITLLKNKGSFAYIVPSAVMTINYAEELRKWLLSEKALRIIVDARGEAVFPNVGVSTCILVVDNQTPETNQEIQIVSLPNFRKGTFSRILKQSQFKRLSGSAFQIDVAVKDDHLRQKMAIASEKLESYCYFTTGFVGHNSKTGMSVDRLIHHVKAGEHYKPYIEAKEWGGRYSWLVPTRYIDYLPKEMHRPKYPKLFESPKILVQRISNERTITATLDTQKIYVNHVINCCVKAEEVVDLGSKRLHFDTDLFILPNSYDLYFLLAIIASSAIGYYHSKFLSPGIDIFPETLRQIPIRRIAFTTPEAERAALHAEGVALYAAGQHAELLHFCKERLAAVPEQSDVVHDILAHLAEQMIALHKERQSALEDLLLDLEGVLAPGLLEQMGRLYTPPRPPQEGDKELAAKQAKYDATLAAATAQLGVLATRRLELRDDIGSLSETQWKWLVKQRLKNKLGSMAELVKVYRSRQPAIAALDQRSAATDRLIDQIVYALYGLSEEEIALVEGEGNTPCMAQG